MPVGPLRPGGTSRFAQLSTVRGHAAHTADEEAHEATEERDRWIVELARSRPRLGASTERRWLEALDDDLAALRAALQQTVVDTTTSAGINLLSRLGLYWYYRGMTIEGQRWLECAFGRQDMADPLSFGLVRLSLAGLHCLQTRGDLAAPHLQAGLAAVGEGTDADPLLLGDGLAQLTGPLYNVGVRPQLHDISARLHGLASRTGDGQLALLADLAELHILLLDQAPPAELLARCSEIHDRAVAVGNSYAAWTVALRAAVICLLSDAPTEGLAWSERMVETQLALGNRNGAAAFAVRANLLAAAGSSQEAMRLYAATRTHHRYAGLRWPHDELTRSLLERATSRLNRQTVEQARAEGHSLTMADLARPGHRAGYPAVTATSRGPRRAGST